jgi:hypothetical protein
LYAEKKSKQGGVAGRAVRPTHAAIGGGEP